MSFPLRLKLGTMDSQMFLVVTEGEDLLTTVRRFLVALAAWFYNDTRGHAFGFTFVAAEELGDRLSTGNGVVLIAVFVEAVTVARFLSRLRFLLGWLCRCSGGGVVVIADSVAIVGRATLDASDRG